MHLRDSFDCAAVFLFICDASGGRRDVHGNVLADHNVHHAPRFPEACGSGPVSYIVSAEREALMPFSSITDSERLSVVMAAYERAWAAIEARGKIVNESA